MAFLKRSKCHYDGVPVIEKIRFMHKDTPIRSDHSFKRTQKDDIQSCNGPFKALWALAHLFMLQAIILHATAKHTFAIRRTRSRPMPCARFNSEFVASIPERILYRSFHAVVC